MFIFDFHIWWNYQNGFGRVGGYLRSLNDLFTDRYICEIECQKCARKQWVKDGMTPTLKWSCVNYVISITLYYNNENTPRNTHIRTPWPLSYLNRNIQIILTWTFSPSWERPGNHAFIWLYRKCGYSILKNMYVCLLTPNSETTRVKNSTTPFSLFWKLSRLGPFLSWNDLDHENASFSLVACSLCV